MRFRFLNMIVFVVLLACLVSSEGVRENGDQLEEVSQPFMTECSDWEDATDNDAIASLKR